MTFESTTVVGESSPPDGRSDSGETLWRVDLHSHTCFSGDSRTSPEVLIRRAMQVGLHRLAITDHDTIAGALEARRIAPGFVIVGEEIATRDGELLAYFLEEPIPPGLTLAGALREIRAQGAIVSVSHPADPYRRGSALGLDRLREIAGEIDAVEVLNARCLSPNTNALAQQFARERGLPGTAGSDAHTAREVGAAYVVVPPFEHSPRAFIASLASGTAQGRRTGLLPHFMSTLSRLSNRFAAG